MKKLFPILALSGMILFSAGCQKSEYGIDDLELGLSNSFMKTFVTIVFEDASSGEMLTTSEENKIAVAFAGADQSLTMTPGAKRKNQFNTATGTVEFNLDPYAKIPSIDQPVELVLQATCPGYLPASKQIRITSEGNHRIYVKMVKPDNLPGGVTAYSADDFAVATGGTINSPIEQALGSTGAKIELPQGVVLKNYAGVPLEGPLSLEARYYDTRIISPSDLIPGGVNGYYRQPDGTAQDVNLVTGGWMDIEISDSQGNIASQVSSGQIGLTLPVNPRMYNPTTQQSVQTGDKLQLMSFDPANGRWQSEGEATYSPTGVKVGLTHLSTWGLGLTSPKTNVKINLTSTDYDLLNLTYNFRFTEADFNVVIRNSADPAGPPIVDFSINESNNEAFTSLPAGSYSVSLSFRNSWTQSIFKLPESQTLTITGPETAQVTFNLAIVDKFTVLQGYLSYVLNSDNKKVYGENVTFRFREAGTTDWRIMSTGKRGLMTILMKGGSYEAQVSKDGKWEPQTPQIVDVNADIQLFTLTRTSETPDPLKEGELGGSPRPVLTNEEILAQAETISRRAGQLAERLSKMLDEARRDRDIMRANCINRKLTEVNANIRNVEQRARALRDAITAGDGARKSHEYTVLTVLSQKLEQLDQEATQCLSQIVYEPSASQIVSTISANMPNGNSNPDPSFPDHNFSPAIRIMFPILITTTDGTATISFEGVPLAPGGWIRN